MSNVWFISDLHLGHKSILKFQRHSRQGDDLEQHSEWLVDCWNKVVKKNDLVWVLGDVLFDKTHMKYIKKMRGQKNLIMGNHDLFSYEFYKQGFNVVRGFHKKYGMFLSHAPIHTSSLWGKINVHGHDHNGNVNKKLFGLVEVPDTRYVNVCVDLVGGVPVNLDEIRG